MLVADIANDPSHDLLLPGIVEKAEAMIDECSYVHFGIDCRTFTRANVDAYRSNICLFGYRFGHPTFTIEMLDDAILANRLVEFIAEPIE